MNGPRLDVDYGAFWGLEKYIMSRRFTRLSLWLAVLLSSEVLAIGLGEIELDSASQIPELPDWVGDEVTDDVRYYNASLVRHPYRQWNEV